MAKSPYSTKAFKILEAEWYAKIEASGFKNIEDRRRPHLNLAVSQDYRFKHLSLAERRDVEGYFDWAKGVLFSYEFKNETHRKIWELHCEGMSKREIEKDIEHFRPSYRREQIRNIVNLIKKSAK